MRRRVAKRTKKVNFLRPSRAGLAAVGRPATENVSRDERKKAPSAPTREGSQAVDTSIGNGTAQRWANTYVRFLQQVL